MKFSRSILAISVSSIVLTGAFIPAAQAAQVPSNPLYSAWTANIGFTKYRGENIAITSGHCLNKSKVQQRVTQIMQMNYKLHEDPKREVKGIIQISDVKVASGATYSSLYKDVGALEKGDKVQLVLHCNFGSGKNIVSIKTRSKWVTFKG